MEQEQSFTVADLRKQIESQLVKTYTGGDTQTVGAAEQALLRLTQSQEFVPVLINIIINPHSATSMVLAASNYLSVFAKQVLMKGSSTPIQKQAFCEQVISNVLKNPVLYIKFKRSAAKSLGILLDKTKNKKKQLRKVLCEVFAQEVESLNRLEEAQIYYFESIAILGTVLFDSKYDALTAQLVDATLSSLTHIALTLSNSALSDLANVGSENIVRLLHVVVELLSVLQSIVNREDACRKQCFRKLIQDDTILTLVSLVLRFKCPTQPSAFVLTDSEELSQLINSAKAHSIGLLHVSYSFLIGLNNKFVKNIESVIGNPVQKIKLFTETSIIFKLLLSGLQALSQANINLNTVCNSSALHLVQQILKLFSILLEAPEFNNLYSDHIYVLVYKVIQPIFSGVLQNSAAIEEFKEDPEEFLQYWAEVLDSLTRTVVGPKSRDQEHEITLHILAAKLLLKLSKYLDSCLALLFNHIQDSLLNPSCPWDLRIGHLFFVGILASRIGIRKDLTFPIFKSLQAIVNLEKYGQTNLAEPQKMFHSLSFIVMARFQAETRFATKQASLSLLKPVLAILYNSHPLLPLNPALFHANLHLLLNLLKYENAIIASLPEKVLEHLLISLNSSLKTPPRMVDALKQLLKDDIQRYIKPDLILPCVRALVSKINTLTLQILKSPTQTRVTREYLIIVNRCCNVVRLLVCNTSLDPSLIFQLEVQMTPLVRLVESSCTQIQFQEDLLFFIMNCINISKSITPFQIKFVSILPRLLQKYRFNLFRIFHTLNLMFKHGADSLKNEPAALQTILEICLNSINAPLGKDLNQADRTAGVLLLTGFIASCGRAFSKEVWSAIAKTLLARLNDPIKPYQFYHSNLVSCLALVLSIAYETLSQEDILVLTQKVMSRYADIHTAYANKVLVIAMCEIMLRVANIDLTIFLEVCLTALSKLIVTPKDQSTAEQNQQAEGELDQQEQEYGQHVDALSNVITDINVFDYFKNCASSVRSQASWNTAVSKLTPALQEDLKQVLRVQKIGNSHYRVVFKINRPS